VRIVVRAAAFTAVLAAYYGIAALLPAEQQSMAGLVAIATVALGVFLWARSDGRARDLPDGVRDWLVVVAVISVFWWATLLVFEGADDVVARLSEEFLAVVLTAVVLFAPALVGLLMGRDARGA
jgi:uncharacterized membrane protein